MSPPNLHDSDNVSRDPSLEDLGGAPDEENQLTESPNLGTNILDNSHHFHKSSKAVAADDDLNDSAPAIGPSNSDVRRSASSDLLKPKLLAAAGVS